MESSNKREKWIKYFYKIYFKENLSEEETEKCFINKCKNMPDSLYKYTKVKYIEDLLCDDLMFLAPASKLNDPYEGEILYNLEKLHELYINNYLKYILIDNDEEFDENIDNEHLNEILFNLTKEESKKFFDEGVSELKNIVSVICLSECNKINPMWSHYGDEHKGVCIEYDFIPDNKIKRLCFPIDYVQTSDNDFILERILSEGLLNHRLLSQIFLRKSQDWDYEREWRIVIFQDGSENFFNFLTNGNVSYIPFLTPKAVYLGLEIEEKHEKYIKDLCDLRNIPVYKMIKDNSNYNMTYKLYK